jgi:hypothetical protein
MDETKEANEKEWLREERKGERKGKGGRERKREGKIK